MARQNSKILEIRKYRKPVFKARQNKWHQCGAQFGVIDTHIFFAPTRPPVGQNHHSLTLNTKLRLQDIHLMTKNCVCSTSKSINHIRPVLMPSCPPVPTFVFSSLHIKPSFMRRRKGKGRHCCLGDRVYSIPLRHNYFARGSIEV